MTPRDTLHRVQWREELENIKGIGKVDVNFEGKQALIWHDDGLRRAVPVLHHHHNRIAFVTSERVNRRRRGVLVAQRAGVAEVLLGRGAQRCGAGASASPTASW